MQFGIEIMRLFFLSCLFFTYLVGNPTNPTIIAGNAEVSKEINSLIIKASSDQTIIEWDSFSISAKELTQFILPSHTSSVLNRVTSANPSEIFGKLLSNGEIFLINPFGILIGTEGVIDVNRLVASTLELSNKDFLAAGDMAFSGNSKAFIENYGTISAAGNTGIALLGRYIVNVGDIITSQGAALVGAGSSILLKTPEKSIVIKPASNPSHSGIGLDSSGFIQAAKIDCRADGAQYQVAINHTGCVNAISTIKHNGEIYLVAEGGETRISGIGSVIAQQSAEGEATIQILGDTVNVLDKASISCASCYESGNIYIGGGYQGVNPDIFNAKNTSIDPGVTIDASSIMMGNGGQVVVWANETTSFEGTANSNGGLISGNGGVVEISGLKNLIFEGVVNTQAYNGKDGLLILDPTNITISNGITSGGAFNGGSPTNTFSGTAASATLNIASLNTALNSNNVLVTTSSAFGSSGDITIGATTSLNLTTSHTLTLNADNNINIANAFTMNDLDSGTSVLNLIAGNTITQAAPVTATNLAAVNFTTTSGNILIDNAISATASSVTLSSGNDIISQGAGTNALACNNSFWQAANDITFTNDIFITGSGTNPVLLIEANNDININNVITLIGWDNATLQTTVGDIIIDSNIVANGTSEIHLNSARNVINQGTTNLLNDLSGNFTDIEITAVNDVLINSQIDINNYASATFSAGNDFILNDDFEPDNTLLVTVEADRDITITSGNADVIATNGQLLSFSAGRNFTIDEPFTATNIANVTITAQTGDATFQNSSGLLNTNGATTTVNAGNDINVQTIFITTSGNITMQAGQDINVGPGNSISQIGSVSGDISLVAGNDLNITGGTAAGSTRYSQVGFSGSNVNSDINLTVGRDLNVTAGQNTNNYALIGHGSASAGNYQGDIIIHSVGRNVTLSGDTTATGASKFAQIGHARFTSGTSIIDGDIRGPTIGSPAPIEGTLTLNGGSDTTTYALFGHGGRDSNAIETYSGNIMVQANEVVIAGGTSSDAFAGIGFIAISQTGGTNPIMIIEPATVQVISNTDLTMTSNTNGLTAIGARTLVTAAHPTIASLTSVDIQIGGDFSMSSGTGVETDATVGAFGEFGSLSTAVTMDIGGNATITANTGADARISNGMGTNALKDLSLSVGENLLLSAFGLSDASINVGSGNLSVTAEKLTSLSSQTFIQNFGGSNGTLSCESGDISILNGGFVQNSGSGALFLTTTSGTLGFAGSSFASAIGDISISSAKNIVLLDDSFISSTMGSMTTLAKNDVTIGGGGSGPSFLKSMGPGSYTMGGNLLLFGTSPLNEGYVENTTGSLTVVAGSDITIDFYGRIENLGTETLTLVVDNDFPVPPAIGSGSFTLSFLGQAGRVGGGDLRIFTADRALNSISGTGNINGNTFVAGPLFINSATEKWNTYYPSALGGQPFTIFYKNENFIPPATPTITVLDILQANPNAFIPFYELFYILERRGLDPVVSWLVPLIVIDNTGNEILHKRHIPPYQEILNPLFHHQ